jgi:ectoine hydroxylase-related dioxygenase (phytanoyl-CoA dioxygenase family)
MLQCILTASQPSHHCTRGTHQDSPAYYPHGKWHVSVLLPLTPFLQENGTLEVAPICPNMPMEELSKFK